MIPTKADLLRELRVAAERMTGAAALKTRYRPLVCPLERVLGEIPSGGRLFDIGCGSGALLYLALRLRGVAAASGYDVSPEAIAAANALAARTPGMQVKCLSVDEFPELSRFDVITMVDVLHHIPPAGQRAFIRQVYDAMAPGAKIIVADINAGKRLRAFCNQVHDLLLSRQWVHPLRTDAVIQALREAGASVGSPTLVDTLWYSHYLLVAFKPAAHA